VRARPALINLGWDIFSAACMGVLFVGVDSWSNRRYKALALDQIIEALRENESVKNVTIRYCPV
jgi:hypothetical protein